MEIAVEKVKELREKTGAGILDCKKALKECSGDIEKAITYLREKGMASAHRKAGRTTKEGRVSAYIHAGGKIGVLLEVDCETDFVARTEDFQTLVKDVAMHIAAMSPQYVSREDVPQDVVEAEKEILRKQAESSGKPANVIEKIVEGRLEKFFKEACLMEQEFVKNPEITVEELVKQTIAKLGENIQVRRFARFRVGEE